MVRELGFRYLWVDALYIYQDDEEFKTAELGNIGEIYRNASFTIAASAAKGVGVYLVRLVDSAKLLDFFKAYSSLVRLHIDLALCP